MSPSTLPKFRVVGFSGHRQINEPALIAEVIRAELERLRQTSPDEWIALSSVAEGSDQLFVQQARALGLSWHAVLPLPSPEFEKDFSPAEWAKAEALLAMAEHIRVINENGTREDAYLDCGIETVNRADLLLAVWDGDQARGKGGTGDVVAYARSLGRPVIIIDAITQAVHRENMEKLAVGDGSLSALNRLPEKSAGWGDNPFNAPDFIFTFQQKCDYAASHGAPQVRRFIVATVMLHVTATIIAAAALSYNLHFGAIPWLKLFCLASALGVALLLRYHHSHHHWVRCRLASEFCRSALATWGLPRAAPLFEDLDQPAVHALTRSLHILHSRSAAARPISMGEFRRTYVERRIDDQLGYYRRQEARALPLFVRLKVGFWLATILALLCTMAYAVCRSGDIVVPEWIETTVFYFLPVTLPVVAAALISLISINDLQRRVARYREMQTILSENRTRIQYAQTWNTLERVVLKTERALLPGSVGVALDHQLR
jgi:hypothetical protein